MLRVLLGLALLGWLTTIAAVGLGAGISLPPLLELVHKGVVPSHADYNRSGLGSTERGNDADRLLPFE